MLVMKKHALIVVIVLGTLVFMPFPESFSWGFYAHRKINQLAVFTLPPPMIGFYKNHLAYITAHAVDPDRRRYSNKEEGSRHFFDSEYYGAHPFDSVPHRWNDAVEKYTEDTLKAHGIVPWHIDHMVRRLCLAFREENMDLILHYSADLGHYVADAHVPLHTTRNYNGQLTNQQGIHAFWESRIPELKADAYDYFTGRAVYISNPLEAAWDAVRASFLAKDSVLKMEADLNTRFPSDLKYTYETKGNVLSKVYSEAYANAYNEKMGNLVERRMLESVKLVGCLWYTAWVNAGQPDLSRFENREISDSLKQVHLKNEELWKNQHAIPLSGHSE
jgi:hypothetical protein